MARPALVPTTDSDTDSDTRSRILRAALRLFRRHGYHGVGINQILAEAAAPKGSMYHHFPGGKEEIGAAVVVLITDSVLALLDAQPLHIKPEKTIARVGAQMLGTVQRNRYELCALFASFVAEKASAAQLARAVDKAYTHIADRLAARLRAGGFTPARARDRALLVLMLLEGGSLIAAARDDMAPFKLALQQAIALCRSADT